MMGMECFCDWRGPPAAFFCASINVLLLCELRAGFNHQFPYFYFECVRLYPHNFCHVGLVALNPSLFPHPSSRTHLLLCYFKTVFSSRSSSSFSFFSCLGHANLNCFSFAGSFNQIYTYFIRFSHPLGNVARTGCAKSRWGMDNRLSVSVSSRRGIRSRDLCERRRGQRCTCALGGGCGSGLNRRDQKVNEGGARRVEAVLVHEIRGELGAEHGAQICLGHALQHGLEANQLDQRRRGGCIGWN